MGITVDYDREGEAINAIVDVFDVIEENIAKNKLDEEIVQMVVLLPFLTRWNFLFKNSTLFYGIFVE
ncbi:MAG: hypothetical protein LBJ00_13395 [Planctomycetaceae bacterium]|jgi:hypothetical protein|nr:hypothetical protein [Planctomycetaceae bacterium]